MENNGNVCEQCGNKLVIMDIYNSWTKETDKCHACKTCSMTTWGVSEKAFNLAEKYDPTAKQYELGEIAKIIEWALDKREEKEKC